MPPVGFFLFFLWFLFLRTGPTYLALGGYLTPLTSTLGSQVHHSSAASLSNTEGIWAPQPNQLTLLHWLQVAFMHMLKKFLSLAFLGSDI
ncbi:hypothetical protein F4809DRAFT_608733 [Biscogniauxia mediterranea]|nr:hypothetical protein F4809DRAFT_608733 [Biscogniauxia mediterranea]